jgi:hypothetical protein
MKPITSILAFLLSAAIAPALFAAMAVTVSDKALTIGGLSRGGSVAVLSVAREPAYYMAQVVSRCEMLVDTDGDGSIRYLPPRGVAFSSIWVVVELSSGAVVIAAPDGFRPLEMTQRGAGRGKAIEAIAATIDVGRDEVSILIVRPGSAAWSLTARDGSPEDRDNRANGRLRLDLSKLRGLTGTAGDPPHALQKGDVVAVLDAESMEYSVTVNGAGAK